MAGENVKRKNKGIIQKIIYDKKKPLGGVAL